MEVAQSIRSYVSYQFVNSCYHEAHQLIFTIESYTTYVLLLLDFWEPGNIPDRYGFRKIMICLDCMIWLGLGESSELK